MHINTYDNKLSVASQTRDNAWTSQSVDNGYHYHAFVSYTRRGIVPEWLNNHFLPVLSECLANELPDPPKLFVDNRIDVGGLAPRPCKRALSIVLHDCPFEWTVLPA